MEGEVGQSREPLGEPPSATLANPTHRTAMLAPAGRTSFYNDALPTSIHSTVADEKRVYTYRTTAAPLETSRFLPHANYTLQHAMHYPPPSTINLG